MFDKRIQSVLFYTHKLSYFWGAVWTAAGFVAVYSLAAVTKGTVNFSFNGQSTVLAPFLIFMVVMFFVQNYKNLYEIFPLSIGSGRTRKGFFGTLIAHGVITVLAAGLVSAVIAVLEYALIPRLFPGMKSVLSMVTLTPELVLAAFTVGLMLFFWIQLLATLNYRFGWIIWPVIIGVTAVFNFLISMPFMKELDFLQRTRFLLAGEWLQKALGDTTLSYALGNMVNSILFIGITYYLMRNLRVKMTPK